MNRTIWKYEPRSTPHFTLDMPRGARVLDVQVQHGKPQIWALVNPSEAKEPRRFFLAGTGNVIPPEDELHIAFVGTFQIEGGDLVFHLFEAHQRAAKATEGP